MSQQQTETSTRAAESTSFQDVDMNPFESKEDELRALLTHQIDLEIALRKRVAKVIEARIQWAERLKSSLIGGTVLCTAADSASVKQQALEEFRAAHAPLDLDPHTRHPRGPFALQSLSDTPEPTSSASSTSKQLYLIPPTSDPTSFPPILLLSCPYPSCPTPHPSTTLQGLLNHARIAHGPSYAFNSHDEFISSPGTTTVLDPQREPEQYARVRAEGARVSLGGVRGLGALFENGVGVGLGLSKETPALAKLLGREVRKGTIRAFGQDEEVDVESVEDEGSQRWRKYGVWASRPSRKVIDSEHINNDAEENALALPSLPPAKNEAGPLTEHIQSLSRFHVKKRVVVSDWSQSLRRSQVQPDGPTHRWMIRLAAPSYSDHITTFLSSIEVSCASNPPSFEGTISCSAPPFAISRLAKVPFLARVTLKFSDERTKDVSVTQWVDLDPMNSGRPVLGAEQIFDVEVDRNALPRPADISSDGIANTTLWSEDRGVLEGVSQDEAANATEPLFCAVKSETETTLGFLAETSMCDEVLADESVLKPHSKEGDYSKPAYMFFPTRKELLESPHGRRKAIEWQYTRTMLKRLSAEYSNYDADLDPEVVESLSVAQLHAYLTSEDVFPRPEALVSTTRVEEETEDVPLVLAPDYALTPSKFCCICGLNTLVHPPTSNFMDADGFVCSLMSPSYRPTCDVGLWTSMRPLRSAIRRVNPIYGLVTTLGSRYSLRGASQLVDCASPQMTLSMHALTAFWRLKTFCYSAKRRNAAVDSDNSPFSETRFPLELLGIDASHVDRTLAPHALLALVAEIFIKRLVREALRAHGQMLGELTGTAGLTVLTTTHVSRGLMDGRGPEGWLPLMAVARIGMLHTDTV